MSNAASSSPTHLAGLVSAAERQAMPTDAFGWLHGARRNSNGRFQWKHSFALPGPSGSLVTKTDKNNVTIDSSAPIGIERSSAGDFYIALSRNNSIVVLDSKTGRIKGQIQVGAAPFAVLRINRFLFVTNWAGRRPSRGDTSSDSSGTSIRTDPRTGGRSVWSICNAWGGPYRCALHNQNFRSLKSVC